MASLQNGAKLAPGMPNVRTMGSNPVVSNTVPQNIVRNVQAGSHRTPAAPPPAEGHPQPATAAPPAGSLRPTAGSHRLGPTAPPSGVQPQPATAAPTAEINHPAAVSTPLVQRNGLQPAGGANGNSAPSTAKTPTKQRVVAQPWTKAQVNGKSGTRFWPTKTTLPANPPTFDTYDASNGAPYEDAKAEATKAGMNRVPLAAHDTDAPYDWICRIYTRNLAWRNAKTGSDGRREQLDVGAQLDASWTQATAWFAAAAHRPNEAGQWLLTAAHNFLNPVPPHDNNGKVTSMAGSELARADAIFVVAGWKGASEWACGWVDVVSVMQGYFDNKDNLACDGAAIHIASSTIPARFWTGAPSVMALPQSPSAAAPPPFALSGPFTVAGIPGSINRYQDLAALYVGGYRADGHAGLAITDFSHVTVTKQPPDATNQPGALVWSSMHVPTAQGMSGSPGIARVGNDTIAISVLNTTGVGAGFADRGPNVTAVAVDPLNLLLSVEASGIQWKSYSAPGNVTWQILGRIR